MQWLKSNPKLQGFLIAILLTGCAAATVNLAGCNAYNDMRLSLPWDALERSDPAMVQWSNLLDARMYDVCK